MSVDAIAMALSAAIDRSSTKFVLVAMANCANADMTCWPSISYLCGATSQDRKTVMENLKRLREAGFILDTGERKGETGHVPVYALRFTATEPKPEPLNSTENGTGNEAKNGTVDTQTVPNFPCNSPEIPVEQYQISLETVPKTGHGTVSEPSRKSISKKKRDSSDVDFDAMAFLLDRGVDKRVAVDWFGIRKNRGGTNSETALKAVAREAEKAGKTLHEAIEICCLRNWVGFEASWISKSQPSQQHKTDSRHSGFDKIDYSAGIGPNGRF